MTATLLSGTRAAVRFDALSDETRVQIVEMLSHGERCVCDLMSSLDAAQSRLSFHLKTLKDAGLVTDRREGRWVYYTLNADTLEGIETLLESLRRAARTAQKRGACCE